MVQGQAARLPVRDQSAAAFFQGPSRRIRLDRRSDMATVVRVTKISSALLMIPAIASRTRDITRIEARPAR